MCKQRTGDKTQPWGSPVFKTHLLDLKTPVMVCPIKSYSSINLVSEGTEHQRGDTVECLYV